MSRLNIPKETLEELYFEKGMSMKDISLELGVGYNTIVRRFDKYEIPRRTFTEGVQLSFKKKRERGELKVSTLNCPECSKEFEIENFRIGKHKNNFCSVSCSSSFNSREYWKENDTRVLRNCMNCEKALKIPQHKSLKFENSFCDRECHVEYRVKTGSLKGENHPNYSTIDVKCHTCDKVHARTPSKLFERNYCSVTCMSTDYQERMLGKNNPNFIHGSKIYYGPNWERISLSIRDRDNFTCQRCKVHTKEKGELDVHHIIRILSFNGDYVNANKPSNLVTLCKSCHKYVEHTDIDFELPSECIVQPTTEISGQGNLE